MFSKDPLIFNVYRTSPYYHFFDLRCPFKIFFNNIGFFRCFCFNNDICVSQIFEFKILSRPCTINASHFSKINSLLQVLSMISHGTRLKQLLHLMYHCTAADYLEVLRLTMENIF